MSDGPTAFLHETVLYEYMTARFAKGSLRVRQVVISGNIVSKPCWKKVYQLDPIPNTRFPDVSGFGLKNKVKRPAEVKFLTSFFRYHLESREDYVEFRKNQGCIVVLRHDSLPDSLVEDFPTIDVFELDFVDFVSYVNENLTRLLNRQLRSREDSKVWVMQQSPNFWYEGASVPPAKKSGIWCPSDTLSTLDLSPGDLILFARHSGKNYQQVSTYWSNHKEVVSGWLLKGVFVARVLTPIYSRQEYLMRKKLPENTCLWYNETEEAEKNPRVRSRGGKKWPNVFEFSPVINYEGIGIDLSSLYPRISSFVDALRETYTTHVSREISLWAYIMFLEYLAKDHTGKGC